MPFPPSELPARSMCYHSHRHHALLAPEVAQAFLEEQMSKIDEALVAHRFKPEYGYNHALDPWVPDELVLRLMQEYIEYGWIVTREKKEREAIYKHLKFMAPNMTLSTPTKV